MKAYSLWLFWLLALAFIWGVLIATVGLKQISGLNEWVGLFVYPAICWTAAGFLLKSKRSGRVIFAVINTLSAISWIIFSIWAARAFGQHFWR